MIPRSIRYIQAARLRSLRYASAGFPRVTQRHPIPHRALHTPRQPDDSHAKDPKQPSNAASVSDALRETPDSNNSLLSPVHIPEDPYSILKENHPATTILSNSSIVVQRQLEMTNVLIGFEQANKYVIMDPHGKHIGFLAEQEQSIGNTMARQMAKTHRRLTTHVFDRHQREVLRFERPFKMISSRIRVYDAVSEARGSSQASPSTPEAENLKAIIKPDEPQVSQLPISEMRIIGEAQQQFAPLRRKYNLFLSRNMDDVTQESAESGIGSGDISLSSPQSASDPSGATPENMGMAQFAYVDEPVLSWDFSLQSVNKQLIGAVNRNFSGFAREIFTDTGVYALRMDAIGLSQEPRSLASKPGEQSLPADFPGMTLDQRAVMLATAVSVDFDYFSQHSSVAGDAAFLPLWLPGGGSAAEGAAGAAAGEAAAGAAGAGMAEAGAGAAARGAGALGEGAVGGAVGAGTLAGMEAMQRDAYGDTDAPPDDASPQSQDMYDSAANQNAQNPQNPSGQEDVWGEDFSWSDKGGNSASGGGGSGDAGGGSGDGDGGGLLSNLWEWFSDD